MPDTNHHAHPNLQPLFLDLLPPDSEPPLEESQLLFDASTVRDLIRQLDLRFPGLGDQLRHGVAVAIDGDIIADPLLERLAEDSEVFFLPPIEGG